MPLPCQEWAIAVSPPCTSQFWNSFWTLEDRHSQEPQQLLQEAFPEPFPLKKNKAPISEVSKPWSSLGWSGYMPLCLARAQTPLQAAPRLV